MKKYLLAAVLPVFLLGSPLLTATANAHWEFHDQQGQYLFGYTGVENAYEYESEVARNHIKTNVTTLSSEWTTSLGPAIDQHNGAGNKVAIFLGSILFQVDTPAWYLRPFDTVCAIRVQCFPAEDALPKKGLHIPARSV